ncbi:SRPBCC family protein [Candidatus Saccharibacteria bacterium]|nr:SRPBCC family protein [Candidatus Saccharibacteria bacterium]
MKSHIATLSASVLVNTPTAHTFDCLTNWPAQSEWIVGTIVSATKHDGRGVGAEISAFTGMWGIGFTDTMVITAWDPPHKCSVQHTGHIVRGTGDFIVTSISKQQSSFTWSEDFILPFGIIGKIGWTAARPFVRLGLYISLKRFARWAEKTNITPSR